MARDLTGMRKGRLVAKEIVGKKNHRNLWLCQCDCGNTAIYDDAQFVYGTTKSCGCLRQENFEKMLEDSKKGQHNATTTTTYRCWVAMKSRCYSPSATGFKNYGGRGIKVCDRWLHSFENFLADMGERPEKMSLDRIDVNGDYSPENCRWATNHEQSNNRRSNRRIACYGLTLNLKQWAKLLGMNMRTISQLLSFHLPMELIMKWNSKRFKTYYNYSKHCYYVLY